MAFPGATRKIQFEDGPFIAFGLKDTRAKIANEFPNAPIGSIYLTSPTTGGTGKVYVKVAHTGGAVANDWNKVTTALD